jgi:histidyl-tRNA synthetase
MIQKVKGTQDLLDMTLYDAVYSAAYRYFSAAQFSHIQTPIIEHEALFKRSVGQQTDIATKEMYTFSTNEREIFCLRPEGTASVMRAFFEGAVVAKPWQVFTHGPMFRHERPQKGRWRQFSQFNLEAIGISSVVHDVRFIALLNDFFLRHLALHDYVLSINFLGTKEDRAAHRVVLKEFLDKHWSQLCATCVQRADTNILRVFDCKNESCQQLYTQAPYITDHLSPASQAEWEQLNTLLDALSVNRIHNKCLVRGLDYYNKVVFEFSSPLLGAQSAFCGGGQYDLAPAFERKEAVPSIGAAIGMERLLLLLEAAGFPFAAPAKQPLVAVVPLDDSCTVLALFAHQALHRAGISTDILVGGVKKAMKKANAIAASWVVLIGDQEREAGTVLLKNMQTGEQESVGQEYLVSRLFDLGVVVPAKSATHTSGQ